ncbi:TetR/AcrR family transcriptional regulator C-terminal domain-containing protein [Gordonia sp. ABSL1-1]|uniref:TetR/AcrR family transcriptional regulator C-terminal domain-containing protein n=1 Tax=Gordonia sp. ABSL1-1 TaxID=3053923 RepID=UPI0025744BA7|nr:TetR/AcrR family transcriptional regulator C-terminal domain-containing protein [Gordonia sp. ABSL1-1]MDL9938920.1 TetR/AcrR family transcriptional regulator C-terminal domain-containing protein [Gordonia sp. ABSL1-1]
MDQQVPAASRRGSSASGKSTRAALLRAATEVFTEHGETASVAQVCRHAEVFPNQVTYYFGSKEQLFVEVACAAVLRAGRHAENAARQAATVREYTHELVSTLLGPQARNVELFTTAMMIVSRRNDLREHITDTLRILHDRADAALIATLMRTGWQLYSPIDVETKAFWSAIFGLVVQKSATGAEFGYTLQDSVAVLFASLQIPDRILDQPLAYTE